MCIHEFGDQNKYIPNKYYLFAFNFGIYISIICQMSCGYFKYEVKDSNHTDFAEKSSEICKFNVINSEPCRVEKSGVIVTESIGSNINLWLNTTGTNIITTIIPTGYYENNLVLFSDSNLISTNIKSGINIFGVNGSYTTPSLNLASNMSRDKTIVQITQETESLVDSGTPYSNTSPGYRAIPKILKDDEGYTANNVNIVRRTNWDTACDSITGAGGGSADSACKCGLSGTIEERIADCSGHSIIGSESRWDGSVNGNSGQGVWRIVTRTDAMGFSRGREVWRDERTKLIWSSLVSSSINWCKATGSNFIINNPSSEDDPNDYCDNSTYQTIGVWSPGNNKAISTCYEDSDDNSSADFFTSTDAEIDNAGKAGLGFSSNPKIAWRLPTINDFKQADVDGYRFVFPDTIPFGSLEWTSTLISFSRDLAILHGGTAGMVTNSPRNVNYAVRCVGR